MRRLIICADGTWNKPDQEDRGRRKPTNVVKIARAILPIDNTGVSQVTYYDEGVGTHNWWDKFTGGAFGKGLSRNIIEAYRFLVDNYADGDELYLFGFSRGAYTVRSLSGLIGLLGLLPKNHAFYMREAYDVYREKPAQDVIDAFREEHECRSVSIRFLGVWDTVGALGVPIGILEGLNKKYQFHDVGLAACVQNAYHAIAIDERRKPFRPTLWDNVADVRQTMEQVWFVGVHTNVGGGYDNDGLANVPLHWLKDKAALLGLEYDETFLGHYRPWYKDELRNSYKGKYRLLGPYIRTIGAVPRGNETVHDSAVKRVQADPPPEQGAYAPGNLMEYLNRSGETVR